VFYQCALPSGPVLLSKRNAKKGIRGSSNESTWGFESSKDDPFLFNDRKDDLCDDIVVGAGTNPIYAQPTNNYQLWINQYICWYRGVFPKKQDSNKKLTALANGLWTDASGDVGQLMHLLHLQNPQGLQQVQPVGTSKQKRLGAYYEVIPRAPTRTHTLTFQSTSATALRNKDEDFDPSITPPSDHSDSPGKPEPKTGGDKVVPKCVPNAAGCMQGFKVDKDYYREYTDKLEFTSDRFLDWLLADDFAHTMVAKTKSYTYRLFSFAEVVTQWTKEQFVKLLLQYDAGRIRKKKSSKGLTLVRKEVAARAEFKYKVLEIFTKPEADEDWMEQLQTASEEYLHHLTKAIPVMKKSIAGRRAHRNSVFPVDNVKKTYSINIKNNSHVLWAEVLSDLHQKSEYPNKSSKSMYPLTPSQLLELADTIKGGMLTVRPDDDYLETVAPGLPQEDVIQAITRCLPVIVLQCGSKIVVMDLHEMKAADDWLELVWADLDSDEAKEGESKTKKMSPRQPVPESTGESKHKGRMPLHAKFPQIPFLITEYIKQENSAADPKRDKKHMVTSTVLAEVREYLIDKIPELRSWGMGTKVVHHQYRAPNLRFSAGKKYLGAVPCKVPCKKNNLRKANPNAHAVFAQIKYFKEMCSEFREEVVETSNDGKCKIPVGKVSLDRHMNIRRFFHEDDEPNHLDHDYSSDMPTALITCEGILVLKQVSKKNQSLPPGGDLEPDMVSDGEWTNSDDIIPKKQATILPNSTVNHQLLDKHTDKYGRPHVATLCNGQLNVFLRPHKYAPLTTRAHYNDMCVVLNEEMKDPKKSTWPCARMVDTIIAALPTPTYFGCGSCSMNSSLNR
jgi:hypothetical protein